MGALVVRRATTADVKAIRELVDTYAGDGQKLLRKATVTLYESVQEFVVAEADGEIVGCGALHVLWEDLAEVRTVAVRPGSIRTGVGSAILASLLERADLMAVLDAWQRSHDAVEQMRARIGDVPREAR